MRPFAYVGYLMVGSCDLEDALLTYLVWRYTGSYARNGRMGSTGWLARNEGQDGADGEHVTSLGWSPEAFV